ncbi:unnamed protein product, partial [Adineta steineri]
MNDLPQNELGESVSTIQLPMEDQQYFIKKKFKCHGNRKLHHFKRKCRSRGLSEEQIAILIHQRNHTISKQLSTNQMKNNHTEQQHKRKRDLSKQDLLNSSTKSLSQLSISQEARKKAKTSQDKTMLSKVNQSSQTSEEKHTSYKPSKYLRMPRKQLLHSLRLQLNHSLKQEQEQSFVLSRLKT